MSSSTKGVVWWGIAILIGVVLAVGVFLLVYYLSTTIKFETYLLSSDILRSITYMDIAKTYANKSVETCSNINWLEIGKKGGYSEIPANIPTENGIPYWKKDGQDISPSMDVVEAEFDKELLSCVNSFLDKEWKSGNIIISFPRVNIDTKIDGNKFNITVIPEASFKVYTNKENIQVNHSYRFSLYDNNYEKFKELYDKGKALAENKIKNKLNDILGSKKKSYSDSDSSCGRLSCVSCPEDIESNVKNGIDNFAKSESTSDIEVKLERIEEKSSEECEKISDSCSCSTNIFGITSCKRTCTYRYSAKEVINVTILHKKFGMFVYDETMKKVEYNPLQLTFLVEESSSS
jgi:hypothetical protein